MTLLHHLPPLLLLLLLCSHTGSNTPSCTPPSPPLSDIQRDAAFIGDFVYRDSRQSIFPLLRFNCSSGAVVRWTVVGSVVGGGSRYPQFSVWRNVGGTNWESVGHNRLKETDETPTAHVYEKTLSKSSQLQFLAGDIVGVYTPPVPRLSFSHQKGGGDPCHYRAGIAEQLSSININSIIVYNNDDIPLLTLETTPPGCISGLINRDTLLIKAQKLAGETADIRHREATQRIIPELVFPCNGTIRNFTLGALSRTSGSYPELQVWRRSGGEGWVKVHSIASEAAITAGVTLNTHQYLLPEGLALPVQEGDILGIYQPYTLSSRLEIYLTGSSSVSLYYSAQLNPADTFPIAGLVVSSESRVPLVTMEISAVGTTTTVFPTLTTHSLTHTFTHPHPYHPITLQCTTTHVTSSHPHTVTPSPTHHSSRNEETTLIIALVSVSVCLVIGGGVIAVMVVKYVRGVRAAEMVDIRCHMTTSTTNPLPIITDNLDYNPMYQPSSPTTIIQKGKRNSLSMHSNAAYSPRGEGGDKGGACNQATNKQNTDEDHIYESIPI